MSVGSSFPTTCWSRIIVPSQGEGTSQREALEALARAYWRPVYAYVRARWGRTEEDARDLTQDFFLWMLEGDLLTGADRDRGRFRAFLKVALQHYVTDQHRKEQAQKRGGGQVVLPLDLSREELPRLDLPDRAGRTPDEVLDDAWRRELLARANDMLEESFRREVKETTFAVFRDYYVSESGELDYAAVAARYGLSASDVSNRLQAAKARYREVLRRLVEETVQGDGDLREELNWLFGGSRR